MKYNIFEENHAISAGDLENFEVFDDVSEAVEYINKMQVKSKDVSSAI